MRLFPLFWCHISTMRNKSHITFLLPSQRFPNYEHSSCSDVYRKCSRLIILLCCFLHSDRYNSVFRDSDWRSQAYRGDRTVARPDHEISARMCIHSDIQIVHDSALYLRLVLERLISSLWLFFIFWAGSVLIYQKERSGYQVHQMKSKLSLRHFLSIPCMFPVHGPVRPLRGAAADWACIDPARSRPVGGV